MTRPTITKYSQYKALSNGASYTFHGSNYTKGSEPTAIKSQLHALKAAGSAHKHSVQQAAANAPTITQYKQYKALGNGASYKFNGTHYTKGSEPTAVKNQLETMKRNNSAKKRNNEKFMNQRGQAHNDATAHAQHQAQRAAAQTAHTQHQQHRNSVQAAHAAHLAAQTARRNSPNVPNQGNGAGAGIGNSASKTPKTPSPNAPKSPVSPAKSNKKKIVDLDNVGMKDLGGHYIELQQVTSSGDTLQFNNNWSRNNGIFYVNTGSNSKLKLNTGIPNGKPFGKGENASGSAEPGYDRVYAEIDAFKIASDGNLVVDIFPSNKLALENADTIPDDTKRKQTLKKVQFHQMPIAYITDNMVPVIDESTHQVKKDPQGHPEYQVSTKLPLEVVYRAQVNYHNPYEMTPDWYRMPVQASGDNSPMKNEDNVKVSDHSEAVSLLEGLSRYLRGVDRVSYDYYTVPEEEMVANLVDENQFSLVPASKGLDGIAMANAKLETLLPNGILSAKDNPAGGMPINNQETAEDSIVIKDQNGNHVAVTNKAHQVMGDLGILPETDVSQSK